MTNEDELNGISYKIYLYLVKAERSCGPRDVMHDLELSSPAVAHRGLQKLLELGLAQKDVYGRYLIKEKIYFRGYFWVGKNLIHRLIIFGSLFIGFLIPEIVVLYTRWINLETVEPYIFLVIVTLLSALIFLIEGLQLQKHRLSKKWL